MSPLLFALLPATSPLDFAYTLSARLPEAPARMERYAVEPGADADQLDLLGALFDLSGPVVAEEALGGLLHAEGQGSHLYVYDHGGAAYHDLLLGNGEAPIRPMPEDWLWSEADALIASMDLFDRGPVSLVPDQAGAKVGERFGADGRSQGRFIAEQAVRYTQTVDGWPATGPGADLLLTFGEGGVITSFSHGVRALSPIGEAPIQSPAEAVATWARRAQRTGHYNQHLVATPGLEQVDVEQVDLAYFLPAPGVAIEEVEPVYVLTGTVHFGQGQTADLLWLEPATRGAALPAQEPFIAELIVPAHSRLVTR
jgi:hypothetical protein